MAIADDLADLKLSLQRLVQIVEGLQAQVAQQEAEGLKRIGAPPRVTRKA